MPRPYYFFGKSGIFLPKLIGAFLLTIALIMFVVASGQMFDTWDALKKYPECIGTKDLEIDSFTQIQHCKQSLGEITGLNLRPDQGRPTTRQFIITLLPPIAGLFFWAVVFLFGLIFYQTGIVKMLPHKKVKKKKRGRK